MLNDPHRIAISFIFSQADKYFSVRTDGRTTLFLLDLGPFTGLCYFSFRKSGGPMRIFLYDQNPDRKKALISALAKVAIRPELLDSPDTVRALPALCGAAAGLLPIILGQDDGTLALVTDLRRASAQNAILVVTDRRLAERDATLLDAGVSDVLSLPLHSGELAARLRAAVRHRNGLVQTEVRIGDLVVHLDGSDPTVLSRPISLSAKENAVLCLLATNRGRVLPRAAIFDLLYGLTEYQPFDKAIDIHICRIRNKLAQGAPHARGYIETFPGRGYALRPTASELPKVVLSES